MKPKKIAILTGGGDCPGLNAVIRAVTKKAIHEYGLEVVGFRYGYDGLINNDVCQLSLQDVSGILTLGGTILGTSNKTNPYKYIDPDGKIDDVKDLSKQAIANLNKNQIDALVCIGGDGTLSIANRFHQDGVPVVGVPKTIDNDITGTDITFGFDTAVEIVTEGIDRLHTTAQSHQRAMIIETMGRTAGWIALHAGIAGGGDVILLPEIPYDINKIADAISKRRRSGKRFTIIVVSEGAKPIGGQVTVKRMVKDTSEPMRLGGVSFVLGNQIEDLTGIESRSVVMGHLQRGGSPSSFDRILATRLGTRAVDLIIHKRFGNMVGVCCDELIDVPLTTVAKGARLVPVDHQLIKSAESIETFFGN